MKIKTLTMGIIIFVIIFGGIGATLAVDLWSTTSEKIPVKFTDGEFSGIYNPADIRGSYTFAEVSELFEIDLQDLYKAFNIPLDTAGTEIQSKDLEGLYEESGAEIGNESVQIFVALYKDLPIELDETYLPKQAVELILQANGNLTEEQKDYLATHTLDIIAASISEKITSGQTPTETPESNTEESESVVNGSTTFKQVLDAGVTKEEIEVILNASMPSSNQTVKDFCIEAELSFSEVKEKLNALIE
ncbi:MAG: hypothetical protein WBL93_02160 [Lutisporaceae bacterium]